LDECMRRLFALLSYAAMLGLAGVGLVLMFLNYSGRLELWLNSGRFGVWLIAGYGFLVSSGLYLLWRDLSATAHARWRVQRRNQVTRKQFPTYQINLQALRSRAPDTTEEDEAGEKQRLQEYVSLFRAFPKPTIDQMWAFAHHVSRAHSWYKHLPLLPPGSPFSFFCDPGAGMQRTIERDGSIQVLERHERGFHYSWLPTPEYRTKFSCLAFARPRGTSVSLMQGGRHLVPSDNSARFYHPGKAQIMTVPTFIVRLGTSYVSALIHPAGPDRLLRIPAPPQPLAKGCWPEAAGGPQQLERILDRLDKLRGEPSAARRYSPQDWQKDPGLVSVRDVELYELLGPERERQQRGIVEACQRVSDFIWGGTESARRA
jgi:hypothetical protein